jgi:hypothetical protein
LISVKRLGSVSLISEEYSKGKQLKACGNTCCLTQQIQRPKHVSQRHIVLVILFCPPGRNGSPEYRLCLASKWEAYHVLQEPQLLHPALGRAVPQP